LSGVNRRLRLWWYFSLYEQFPGSFAEASFETIVVDVDVEHPVSFPRQGALGVILCRQVARPRLDVGHRQKVNPAASLTDCEILRSELGSVGSKGGKINKRICPIYRMSTTFMDRYEQFRKEKKGCYSWKEV
jgi:hypothetical protein